MGWTLGKHRNFYENGEGMKQASDELINFLATLESDKLRLADLYTFKLTNGTVLRFTSADFDITINGNTFSHKNAGISRSSMAWATGLSVDDVTLEFNPSEEDKLEEITLVEAFRNGSFDGAEVQIDIAFYADGWDNEPLVLEKLFVGNIDVDEIGGSYVKASIKSYTELLNAAFPSQVYQASCCYALYGAGCGVNRANFSEDAYVLSNSTKKQINCQLRQAAGYYQNGVVTFLTGKNINIKKSVKVHQSGFLTLSTPLPYVPAIGDKFSVSAGCNKTISMCESKFHNKANYSGTPFVPKADSTVKF